MKIAPLVNIRPQHPAMYLNLPIQNFGKEEKTSYPLSKKYNIDGENIPVISAPNIHVTKEEKAELVEKIIEAHELALKNYNYGNISKAGYATNVRLTNGNWYLATNFNNTRNDISAICGERSAILGAYNDLLKSKPIIPPSDKPVLDFKVKYLAMSNYKPLGTDKKAASSCSECLSWFNTTRYFDDNTIIASLEKDDKTGNYFLVLNSIKQYLPLRNEIPQLFSEEERNMPVKFTKEALDSAKEKGITEEDILNLIKRTQQVYKTNELAQTSNQNIAVSVLAQNEIFSAPKIDFSKRWYIDPAQYAAAKAIEKFGNDTKLDAICYLGNGLVTDKYGIMHNDGIVNIKTLGALNTKYADKNTLIITTTKEAINVRTIENYMPDKFRFIQAYNIQ